MCYRIAFSSEIDSIYDLLPELAHSQLDFSFSPTNHSVAQGNPRWPVVLYEDGCLKVKYFEWGFVSKYMKGQTLKDLREQRKWMYNIRSEKILGEKRVWNENRHRRCLIPVTGFYEFRDVGWKTKVPYFIRIRGRKVFLLPALYRYSHIPDEQGELVGTFAIGIRDANQVMRQIHNSGDNPGRMPLMLPTSMELEWLKPDLTDEGIQSIVSYEIPSSELEYWPVKSLYRVDPFDPEVILPCVYENLPPLAV